MNDHTAVNSQSDEGELDPLSPECVERIKSMSKDDVDYLTKRERREVEEQAAAQWEATPKDKQEKLKKKIAEACEEYTGAISEAVQTAGESLALEMHELRRQWGTLIVDAALDDDASLDTVGRPVEVSGPEHCGCRGGM